MSPLHLEDQTQTPLQKKTSARIVSNLKIELKNIKKNQFYKSLYLTLEKILWGGRKVFLLVHIGGLSQLDSFHSDVNILWNSPIPEAKLVLGMFLQKDPRKN